MRIQVELSEALQDYVGEVSLREPEVLRELRAVTDALPERLMQISPEQGQFMQLLIKAVGARRTIEVGVFTGYSLLSTALALPPDGWVIGCDISTEWAAIAKEFCNRAGVADRVDLRIGDATETLQGLLDAGEGDTYDFVFIDADKPRYESYYELALQLVRPGGLIVVDNVLWHGAVIDPEAVDEDTVALRAFNEKVHHDKRVELSMVPCSDGLTFLLKC